MLLNVNYKMTRFQFDLVNNCPKRGFMLSTRHNSSYSLSMVSSEINPNYLRIHANANDKVPHKCRKMNLMSFFTSQEIIAALVVI